eukprot:2833113-Pyramimonas_sp.AAC.1
MNVARSKNVARSVDLFFGSLFWLGFVRGSQSGDGEEYPPGAGANRGTGRSIRLEYLVPHGQRVQSAARELPQPVRCARARGGIWKGGPCRHQPYQQPAADDGEEEPLQIRR